MLDGHEDGRELVCCLGSMGKGQVEKMCVAHVVRHVAKSEVCTWITKLHVKCKNVGGMWKHRENRTHEECRGVWSIGKLTERRCWRRGQSLVSNVNG